MLRRLVPRASGAVLLCGLIAPSSSSALSVKASGNHLVDGAGHTVRLLGVNRSGMEYACSQGWGFFEGPGAERADSQTMVNAMLSWRINAVRLLVSENCWNGTNSVPANRARSHYRRAVGAEIARYRKNGLYVIIALHGSEPKGLPAGTTQGLRAMPDAYNAIPFWRSVAKTYGKDAGVVFGLYNEPNGPATWKCLRDGCTIRSDFYLRHIRPYRAVGMQKLVTTVRRAGARNLLLVPGLAWTSDLSRWYAYRPHDPLHDIAASFHTYDDEEDHCVPSCWAAPGALSRRIPVVTDELGDLDCNHDYTDAYMRWADARGISYLGFTWDAPKGPGNWPCGAPSLITNYDGTPTGFGIGLRDHLRALAGAG
jgi:hypothetical protein